MGASIHAFILRSGFDSNVFVCNEVVSMYDKCNVLVHARKVFEELCHRGTCDLVSWNSIVSAYSHCFVLKVAVSLFREMTVSYGLISDVVGVVNILPVCGFLGLGLLGKQVHAGKARVEQIELFSNFLARILMISLLFFDHRSLVGYPTEIESYIRPGCIILTICLRLENSAWDELCYNLGSRLRKLLAASNNSLWRIGLI
ncbi:unnamed protein product [Lathyrus sativus]|nr:unnamed protein product [Lathyrus sativus]